MVGIHLSSGLRSAPVYSGQVDLENAASPRQIFHFDRTVIQFNGSLGDCKAQPYAIAVLVLLLKRLE